MHGHDDEHLLLRTLELFVHCVASQLSALPLHLPPEHESRAGGNVNELLLCWHCSTGPLTALTKKKHVNEMRLHHNCSTGPKTTLGTQA